MTLDALKKLDDELDLKLSIKKSMFMSLLLKFFKM